jgi:hypothetical protein
MIKNLVKEMGMKMLEAAIEVAQTRLFNKKIGLYTSKDNPELIQSVTQELRNREMSLVLGKLQDLEKAVYHVAGKQQDVVLGQKHLEEMVVKTATCVEEMAHGIDVAINNETSEEEYLTDAWDTKKNTSPSN